MTVNQREMLSALVDGQLTGKALDKAVLLVSTDATARSDFLRYQQSSDVMHGYTRGIGHQPINLADRLAVALENEPAYQQSRLRKTKILQFPAKLWKQAGGLAVAASVGALAVMGVMNQPTALQPQPPTMAVVDTPPPASETLQVTTQVSNQVSRPTQINRWTVGEPEVEDRLNNYLVDHSEYASGTSMFSYGRVVSYGTEQ